MIRLWRRPALTCQSFFHNAMGKSWRLAHKGIFLAVMLSPLSSLALLSRPSGAWIETPFDDTPSPISPPREGIFLG